MSLTWRRLIAPTLLSGILALHGQTAQPLSPPEADKDPFVGTWKANRLRSHPTLSKKDALYTRTIVREGDQRVVNSIVGDDKKTAHSFRIICDGYAHDLPYAKVDMTCRYIAPNVTVGETSDRFGHNLGYWTEEVSADGLQMTVTNYKDKARTRSKAVLVLDRMR